MPSERPKFVKIEIADSESESNLCPKLGHENILKWYPGLRSWIETNGSLQYDDEIFPASRMKSYNLY